MSFIRESSLYNYCFWNMGGAVSVTNFFEQELQKPLDGSDITDHQSGVDEVVRLRQIIHSYHIALANSAPAVVEENIPANNDVDASSSNYDEMSSQKRHKDFHKILGVDEEQMKRNIAMKKLGVTEDAYEQANEILLHNRIGVVGPNDEKLHKKEVVLGYHEEQLKREKAVKQLGTSESFMERKRAEDLGAVGLDAANE